MICSNISAPAPFVIDDVCCRLTQTTSLGKMHPPSASFLGGLRMYKIVLLGEGGVGKSGQFNICTCHYKYVRRLIA